MKSCDEVLDLLPEHAAWLTGEGLEVQEHLKLCEACREAAEELGHTLRLLREQAPAAPALADDFADRVLAALPPAEAPAPAATADAPAGRLVRFPPALLRAAAAVACFAAGLATAQLGGGAAPSSDVARSDAEVVDAPAPGPSPAPRDPPQDAGPSAAPAAEPRAEPGTDLTPAVAARPAALDEALAAPLGHYVSEAGLVLQAVAALDEPDPRWLEVLSLHIQDAALLDQGERLLLAGQRGEGLPAELRPLIAGTQLILRKLRNAPTTDAPDTLQTLRREVQETGILDAYQALLTAETPTEEPAGGVSGPL